MAKEFQFNWRPNVPSLLQHGSVFDRYDDESTCLETNAHVRVDEYGFFLYWLVEARDAVVLDMSQVWEARPSGLPKDGRVLFELEQRGSRETLEERTIWITHGQDLVNVQSFYLVAETVEIAKAWRIGINEILKNCKMRHVCPTTNLLRYWKWLTLSVNDRRKIPIKLLVKTFASGKPEKMVLKCLSDLGLCGDKYTVPRVMNRSMGKKFTNIYKCSSGRKKKEREELDVEILTFEKFIRLYNKICPRSEVQELFVKLSGQKEYLTRDRLTNFLNEEQRDPRLNEILFPFFDNTRTQVLISKYEQDNNYIENGKMSGDAFLRFLMSDENSPVFLDRIDMHQDMDQPLCHYYINSSHNTYLTGRQYGGKSSSEIYRQVLLSGCRCIELDCWDGTGENKGEPIITHGKAMCTDVFFRDVLYQIRDTAFARSEFPVILSFENHCSKSNQLKMAKYCMDIFGDMLLAKPLDDFPLDAGVPLPSPNRLRRKILIKNKRLKPEIEKHQLDQFLREGKLDEEDEIAETPEVVGEDSISPRRVLSYCNILRSVLGTRQRAASTRLSNSGAGDQRAHPEVEPPAVTCPAIKPPTPGNNLHYHMSSFSESTGLGYLKQCAPEFVNYNKRQLSRIYPKGARVDSSNFLPQIFWNAGCQMVALNFQTPDVYMQLNMGKFEYNAGSGYLLKPDFMRRPDRTFDPFSESPVDGVIAAHCSVRVISGQFLTDRKVGTYVEVEMYGLPTDTIRKEHKTKVIPANGLNPVYSEAPFVFRKVVLPELAVLRFAVYDENGKQLGQRILPLDGLQAGYRHISLRSDTNQTMVLAPTLFVHIVIKTYVPDELSGLVDALADPRAYLSEQKKRQEALAHMGVDDSDIVEVPAKANAAKSKILQKTNGSAANLLNEKENPPSSARSDGNVASTGSSKPNNEAASAPVDKFKGLATGFSWKRPLARNTRADGPHQNTHLSAPPDGRKPCPESISAQFNTSMRRASMRKQDDKLQVEPIEVDDLKKDKLFAKLLKKFQKENEELKKKHQKQRDSIQKQQQTNVDKLMTNNRRSTRKEKGTRRQASENFDSAGASDMATNDRVRSLVNVQTDEWSAMMRRHEAEEFELRKTQLREQTETLRKLLLEAQKVQMQGLKLRLENETKELKQTQTKKSMEDAKILNLDKGIKTKAERERRLKELHEKNLKMFVEERKRLAKKGEKHEEQLAKRHQDQLEQLEREAAKALEQEEANFREDQLSSKPASKLLYVKYASSVISEDRHQMLTVVWSLLVSIYYLSCGLFSYLSLQQQRYFRSHCTFLTTVNLL
ncbi:Phosphatidylinositol-specific phospholipase C, X domain protein [Necator americanus]|uniref:1-phosphatidylinositol 4,5-bisphosphate phosphodiesterase n=1 Tax=Necator americanus TaxID=51031 RepID=W2SW98_NECAM|nr:Phosphatidylinositol-specific phospholipase C, X domain protein [Necator americanus]ETN73900.1 Phosphatidylinositol-specific phospholipase C, X domain protein [Necator americanus]